MNENVKNWGKLKKNVVVTRRGVYRWWQRLQTH